MANLQHLNIKIYTAMPSSLTYNEGVIAAASGTLADALSTLAPEGTMVFLEPAQQIVINGKLFGIDNLVAYNALKTSVATLKGSDTTVGSVAKSIKDALATYTTTNLGTLTDAAIGTSDDTTAKTVEALLKELVGLINNASASGATGIYLANQGRAAGATGIYLANQAGAAGATGIYLANQGRAAGATGIYLAEQAQTAANNAQNTADGKVASVTINGASGAIANTGTVTNPVFNIDGSHILSATGATKTIADKFSEIDQSLSAGGTAAVLHLYSGESGQTTATEVKADGTTYRLVQGSGTGADASTGLVAKFNIEKDSFVKDGNVVTGKLNGDTWQTIAGPTGTAHIHLVIGTTDGNEKDLYIPAESLVDSYTTGSTNTDVVKIQVDNDANKISATFGITSVTKAQTAGTDGLALSVTTENGSVKTVLGSIAANTYDTYGAAATAAANMQTTLIGASNAAANTNTINGAKAYADNAANDVLGSTSDAAGTATVYGALAAAQAASSNAAQVISWEVLPSA